MGDQNFSIKVTLEEANDIKEALEWKMAHLISLRPKWQDHPELAHQAGRIETMLRRDF